MSSINHVGSNEQNSFFYTEYYFYLKYVLHPK